MTDLNINAIINKSDIRLGSDYVKSERRSYSLYTLETRSIPAMTDGLKAAARRILWIARDGSKNKSAKLAGETMCIHPHSSPESTINTLAGKYINNVCLLDGEGAFGTRLVPDAFGASRYTSVKISAFTKDVMFRDIDLIPMKDNYDITLLEPAHFLPLVPIVLLNPTEGINDGFACDIHPRDLKDVIEDQILYLKGKKLKNGNPVVNFLSIPQVSSKMEDRWVFEGQYELINRSTIKVTELPYGMDYQKYISFLDKLEEKETIKSYIDESSENISITIKVPLSFTADESSISDNLKLRIALTENMTVIGLDHKTVLTPSYNDIISTFTSWRVDWFLKRFQKQLALLGEDLVLQQEIIKVIDLVQNEDFGKVITTMSRAEFKEVLHEIGVTNVDYVSSLPIYRFTSDERNKIQQKIDELKAQIKDIKSKNSFQGATETYIEELMEVQKNNVKGKYKTSDK